MRMSSREVCSHPPHIPQLPKVGLENLISGLGVKHRGSGDLQELEQENPQVVQLRQKDRKTARLRPRWYGGDHQEGQGSPEERRE